LRWRNIYKSEGILYNVLVNPCGWAQHIVLKRMELWGKDKVPTDVPLIIAANHPTAFMDPILLAALLDEPMYHMTRGDIFAKPLANMVLRSMNMFPVYRTRDGYGGSRRNQMVFQYVLDKLKEHKTIVIFVEGQHHLSSELLYPQKGIAHLAQYALEQGSDLQNLKILPIGINYLHGDKKWDDVSIVIGDAFDAKDYFQPDTEGDKGAGLLKRIDADLKQLVHHLENKNDQSIFDLGRIMHRSEANHRVLPQVKQHNRANYDLDMALVGRINAKPEAEKEAIRTEAETYTKELEKARITDGEVYRGGARNGLDFWYLVLFFVPFLLGYLGATPIRLLSDWLVKNKVKKPEFTTSVHAGVGILFGALWYGAVAIWGFLSGHPYLIALTLSLPLLGWFVNLYLERASNFFRAGRAKNLPQLGQLQQLRAALRTKLY
jgi:glycerol-3-phosphate O-acyltransferase / dihydroxyacetone phosphate acyltransferase